MGWARPERRAGSEPGSETDPMIDPALSRFIQLDTDPRVATTVELADPEVPTLGTSAKTVDAEWGCSDLRAHGRPSGSDGPFGEESDVNEIAIVRDDRHRDALPRIEWGA
jgi:hypothetical protein